MFDSLRYAFREAVENFKEELGRDDVPEAVSRLLRGMKREAADTKAEVRRLGEAITGAIERAEKERGEGETCRRREKLALDISDEETAALARQFAEKHEEHQQLLEQKAKALRAELDFRGEEVEEMMAKAKEAHAKRDSLSATAGRSGARESISAADDLFSELDRMAGKIDDEQAKGEAAEAFSDLDLGPEQSDYHIDLDEPPQPEPDYDARLAEVKRRMGEE